MKRVEPPAERAREEKYDGSDETREGIEYSDHGDCAKQRGVARKWLIGEIRRCNRSECDRDEWRHHREWTECSAEI